MGVLTTVPFHKLKLAPDNIRKSSPGAQKDLELKASIETHGVLMNLIVSPEPKGIKFVRAGKRRFEAVAALVAEKKLAKSYPVPCYVLDEDENAEEAALIENTLRADMHPVDEYESYSRLHFEHGLTIDQIAARFGRAAVDIKKRLRLGNVATEIRDACRAGHVSLDCLTAFTCTEDQTRQLEVYHSLVKQHGANHIWANHVRQALTKATYHSTEPMVRIINLDEYVAAGGSLTTDLFQDVSYLHDVQLVDELIQQKLTDTAEKLRADGWSWADVNLDFYNNPIRFPHKLDPTPSPELAEKINAARLKAEKLGEDYDTDEYYELPDDEQKKIEQLYFAASDELEALEAVAETQFTPEQKAVAGCVITRDHSGLKILYGYQRKEDLRKAAPVAGNTDAGTDAAPGDTAAETTTAAAPEEESTQLSQTLVNDLKLYRLAAIQLDLYYTREVALNAMTFTIAWQSLLSPVDRGWKNGPINLALSRHPMKVSVEDPRMTQTMAELNKNAESLNLKWLDSENIVESYRAWSQLPQKDKDAILAWCAASHLGLHEELLNAIQQDCNTNLAKYWRPTRVNYFRRAPTSVCLREGAEIFDDEDFPHMHRAKSRIDLSHILDERIQQMPIDNCWMPAMMRV